MKAKSLVEFLKESGVDDVEVTNLIYDTLMGNTQHPQFDVDKVSDQEVDARKGTIFFKYGPLSIEIKVRKL